MAGILEVFGRLGQLYMAMEQGKQSRAQRIYTQQQAALEAARQQQKELQPLQEQVAGLVGLALPSVQAAFPGATVTQLPMTGMNREQLTGIAGQLFPAAMQNVPQGMTIQGPGGLSYTPPKPEPPPTDTPQTRRAAREAQLRSVVVNYGANPELVASLPESRLAPMALSMSRGLLTQKTDPKTGEPIYTLGEFTPLEAARTTGVEATTELTWQQVEEQKLENAATLIRQPFIAGKEQAELENILASTRYRISEAIQTEAENDFAELTLDDRVAQVHWMALYREALTGEVKANTAMAYYMMKHFKPEQLEIMARQAGASEEQAKAATARIVESARQWNTPSANAQLRGQTPSGASSGGRSPGTADLSDMGVIPEGLYPPRTPR